MQSTLFREFANRLVVGMIFIACNLYSCHTRSCVAQVPNVWEVQKNDQGVELIEAGKKVLFWQTAEKSMEGRFARANYIHPLYRLDGQSWTDDFPADHLHHRGVFWAWHFVQLNGERVGDAWELKDFAYEVTKTEHAFDPDCCRLMSNIIWLHRPDKTNPTKTKRIADEITTIRIYPTVDGKRRIDFQIEIQANYGALLLGGSEDEKGYGGFSVRAQFPNKLKFVSEQGELMPQITGLSGGGWLDFSGEFPGTENRQGIVILVPQSHPKFPLPWILRASGSMQNAVFPGRKAIRIEPHRSLTLNYGLVIHDREMTELELKQEYELYSKRIKP